MMNPTL